MGSTTQSIDMPNLTLYQANGACSLIPHAILRHYKISFNAIRLKFTPNGVEAADGSFNNTQYRSIHPRGYVPALTVGNEVITEMPAILSYISSLIPEENLLGSKPVETAKVLEWLVFLSGTLHGLGYGAWLRPGRFSDDATAHYQIKEKGKQIIHESFKRIDDGVKGRGYIVGNRLTAVDFNVYVFARWAHEVDIDLKTEYQFYYEHVRKVEKITGVREAIEAEGLQYVFA